jgi:hypothetical protein
MGIVVKAGCSVKVLVFGSLAGLNRKSNLLLAVLCSPLLIPYCSLATFEILI